MEPTRALEASQARARGGRSTPPRSTRSVSEGGGNQPGCRNPDPLLSELEAAQYLGYKPRTLAGWRYRGGGPVFVSTSKTSVRYRLSDLEAWIASRRRRSTSDPGPGAE